MKKNRRLISLLCTAAILLALLTGCGASTTTEDLVTPKSEPRTDSSSTEVLAEETTQTAADDQTTQSTATEQTTSTAETTDAVTETQAKEIALNHAGLTEDQVTSWQVKSDWEDGQQEYEVEFWVDSTKYEYEMSADTGEVIKYSVENRANSASATDTTAVTETQAKEIALNHAGLTEDQVTSLQVKSDWEDGRQKYEVEFWVDSTKYEYEVSADTGEVIKYSVENRANRASATDTTAVTETQAKEIALNHAGLTEEQVSALQVKLDQDDGQQKYEVEFRKDRTEYDYEIDAATGAILNYEVDVD